MAGAEPELRVAAAEVRLDRLERPREGAAFAPDGGPFAPIVFSHGATNDPIDYAHTLEAIARAGALPLRRTRKTTKR